MRFVERGQILFLRHFLLLYRRRWIMEVSHVRRAEESHPNRVQINNTRLDSFRCRLFYFRESTSQHFSIIQVSCNDWFNGNDRRVIEKCLVENRQTIAKTSHLISHNEADLTGWLPLRRVV